MPAVDVRVLGKVLAVPERGRRPKRRSGAGTFELVPHLILERLER